jgi:PIN domain nuclease of toxin-antitoxin system
LKIAAVADTHAALWFLSADSRLSPAAKRSFDEAARSGDKIAISSISLAEVVYLVEKLRLPAVAFDDLVAALADQRHVLTEVVFDGRIANAMLQVYRSEVPDLPDRIVAATAIYLGVQVISRDRKIRSSRLATIW